MPLLKSVLLQELSPYAVSECFADIVFNMEGSPVLGFVAELAFTT
jgi:hypothetical protein